MFSFEFYQVISQGEKHLDACHFRSSLITRLTFYAPIVISIKFLHIISVHYNT